MTQEGNLYKTINSGATWELKSSEISGTKTIDFINYKAHWLHPAFIQQDPFIQSFIEATLHKYSPEWDNVVCTQHQSLNHRQLAQNVIDAIRKISLPSLE